MERSYSTGFKQVFRICIDYILCMDRKDNKDYWEISQLKKCCDLSQKPDLVEKITNIFEMKNESDIESIL
jgi:hypothetical protein